MSLRTERLILRQWRDEDLPAFAAMGADPEVMRYFPALLSRRESDEYAAKCRALIDARGWGFWAVARQDSGEFIGFVGLHTPGVPLPFSPCVEVGWRLARRHWGQGFATEAARAALRYGFETLQLPEIVAFTALLNVRSQALMQRLGMARDPIGFDHPNVEEGHALRPHCLYRIARPPVTR